MKRRKVSIILVIIGRVYLIQSSVIVSHDLSPYMVYTEMPTLSFGRTKALQNSIVIKRKIIGLLFHDGDKLFK